MRALLIGLMVLGMIGNASVGVTSTGLPINKCAIGVFWESKEVVVQRETKEGAENTEDFLIQNGSKLIAEGDYNRVLNLIKNLPQKARSNIQIRTLEGFANLKGWVANKDQVCKTNWMALRTQLIKLGDNEATPMLVIFLRHKDPHLRVYAAELLSHIGDERALKDLREIGENDENRQVRKNAKWAYEQISGQKF
jgi:hypothetical protein